MIVRDILNRQGDPTVGFDFFNDYGDTRDWLLGVRERQPDSADKVTALLKKLNEGNMKFIAGYNARINGAPSAATYEHFHIADKRYLPCGVYRRGVTPDGKIVDEAFLFPSEHNYPATIRRFTLDRFDLQLGIYEFSGAREASTIDKLAPRGKETLRTRLLAQAQHVVGQPEKKTYYRLLDCKSRALGYCTPGEPIVLYDENHTARLYAPLPLTLEGFDLGWFAVDNVGDLAEFWDQVNPTIREKLRDTLQNQLPMLPMTPQKKGEPRTVTPEQVAESKALAETCGHFFGVTPDITARDREVWRTAITLANNLCVQESDRINGEDGHMEAIHATSECAKRIRDWLTPSDDQMREMLKEVAKKS